MKKIIFLLLLMLIIAGSATAYFVYHKKNDIALSTPQPTISDPYWDFVSEVYDKIQKNYWEKISDEQLSNIYKLATEKILANKIENNPKTKEEVKQLVIETTKDYDNEKKRQFVAQLSDIVLANLKPFGRSRLYTTKEEKALQNNVNNIDSGTDLYSVLGVDKNADKNKIEEQYKIKSEELKKSQASDAKEKLALVERAYQALVVPERKDQYDKNKIEPTVVYKYLTPDIYYIKLSRFSPQSFDELQKAANSVDPKKKDGPTALIFDLRGNIGGAIDILQYFLGPFIGPDQYAYDFFHQEEKQPYKTKVGWFEGFVRYKKVIVLVDGQAQSSAEVMAATLKKYNVGVVVGTHTKGWGTVEAIIPIDKQISDTEKYSLLIVHSITLRDDGQPIEGRGVDPAVNINDKDWPKQLMAYFNYQPLVDQIRKLTTN